MSSNALLAENEKGVFEAILLGEIDFASAPWPTISNSAKDLVSKMLTQDPKKRITAAEVLGMFLLFIVFVCCVRCCSFLFEFMLNWCPCIRFI